MARPKKDSGENAKERIIETFWKLLEDHQLHEISIGMLVSESDCSRGTFYYHFDTKDALISAAVDEELTGVPRTILMLVSGVGLDIERDALDAVYTKRLALFMNHGGRNIVERRVKDSVTRVWTIIADPADGKLKVSTHIILEYLVSGMLGLISCLGDVDEGACSDFPSDFLKKCSAVGLDQICQSEGIEREEILKRLRLFNQLSKLDE